MAIYASSRRRGNLMTFTDHFSDCEDTDTLQPCKSICRANLNLIYQEEEEEEFCTWENIGINQALATRCLRRVSQERTVRTPTCRGQGLFKITNRLPRECIGKYCPRDSISRPKRVSFQ